MPGNYPEENIQPQILSISY